MQRFISVVFAVFLASSCSSPTAPTPPVPEPPGPPPQPVNRLISYTFYPPAGATVKKGDTLLFEQAVLECESTATIFDFAFLRDDGDTLSIGFGGKCRSGVHSGAGWRIELGDRNGLWDFGRGHTVNLVFLVSEGSSTGPPKPLPGGGWYNSVNWDNVRFRADINTDWHFEEGS